MSDAGDDDFYPGGGFIYEQPLVIGSLTINTSHDYMLSIDVIHELLHQAGVPEEEIEMADEDCGDLGDVDAAYGTIEYLQMYLGPQTVYDFSSLGAQLGAMVPQASDSIFSTLNAESGLSQLANEFSLDDLTTDRHKDKLLISPYEPDVRSHLTVKHSLYPPRPPVLPDHDGHAINLVICRSWSRESFKLRSHMKWYDIVGKFLPPGIKRFKEPHFELGNERRTSDAAYDIQSMSTLESMASHLDLEMRSNSRPKGGIVMIEMSSGSYHNVGSHSYRLQQDIIIPLDMSSVDLALAEFFSAPAGEGLACATGSHSLHQMVNAALASSIHQAHTPWNAEVETGIDDITICFPDSGLPDFAIDITSTSGIWHKPLSRRNMVALSKYDVAAIYIKSVSERPAKAFACAIMCSLAVEHPSYYGLPDLEDLTQDLRTQYRISIALNRMSQKTVQALSEMSYHAVVAESVADALDLDPFSEGVPYRVKAQTLLDAISHLKHKERYAVPPFPVSEIRAWYANPVDIKFLDQVLQSPSCVLASVNPGQTLRPENNKNFLRDFPACGRFPYTEVWDLCSQLQTQTLHAQGLTHKGPLQVANCDDPDSDIWNLTSELYAASAIAQFIEIRADVVRLVDTNPSSNPNIWRCGSVYKGKVSVWYRIRDPVTDPRGYRVDWFAISPFQVVGGLNISADTNMPVYLWPRQRLRSQEMDHASMAPRRLKLTLYTMLTMVKTTRTNSKEVYSAWHKLALTSATSTWASGANYITCRHLSSSLSSPSPPFDSMAKKFKPPQTMACIVYFCSLTKALQEWDDRDKYHNRAAILGLPRAFSQLEAYWQVWVPDEFADANKNFTDCVIALYGEYHDLTDTMQIREDDLLSQLEILTRDEIMYQDIRASVRRSCTLETGGKFGWSVFGSLASAYALTKQGNPKHFDKSFARGGKARSLASHLTVRHSGRICRRGKLETGTVAEMILKDGVDEYLSTLEPAVRFYYGDRAYFLNHPKKGELKFREISITNPDSRIMLNDAEHICGEYGRYTSIDMLKRPDKDAYFYRLSAEAMTKGGVIQASDASRFAAMMSNIAVGITCFTLGALGGSSHLSASGSIYQRLASRRMVISTEVYEEIDKRLSQDRSSDEIRLLNRTRKWIQSMPKIGQDGTHVLRSYTTAAHTGQGMSHVGMSLEHGGALLISIFAAEQAQIYISGKHAIVAGIPLVTSDDSTIVAGIDETKSSPLLSRSERQRACHLYLKVQRACRNISLRSVSVMPNLSKEKASGIAGEFNSQDNGIGAACPILGFREMICQLTRPCAPSLIVDYLDAHAYGRTVALSGLGLSSGVYAQRMKLDALEQRWQLRKPEIKALEDTGLIPLPVLYGCDLASVLRTPASMLTQDMRSKLMQLALDHHSASEEVDIHSKDMAFTILGQVSIKMKKQHQHALKVLKAKVSELTLLELPLQAMMLEQSIGSTMSSARTRGAGRIAQRVRNKMVKPNPCLSHEFQRAPMLETTLTWFDFISSKLSSVTPSSEIRALASTYGGYVSAHKVSYIRFPQPATRRRSTGSQARKPKFILDCYGKTPFGRHAVTRSQAIMIKEYTSEQRAQMSLYYASCSFKQIPEHVQYGGRLNLSWTDTTSCVLMPVSRAPETGAKTHYDEFWGTMDEDSLIFLREVEIENPDKPVLALSFASRTKAHFHGIYNGVDYSASIDFDPDTAPRRSVQHSLARGGSEVVLALQGWQRERAWYGSGPTGLEIENYQHSPEIIHSNALIEETWLKVEKETYTSVPVTACLQEIDGKRIMYMINPKMTRACKPMLLPYHRSKFCTSLATGGYWYSSIRGVAFRAYLKGHCGSNNVWTGAVLGWRMSRNSEPEYGWHPPDTGTVRSLAMIGGIDTDEHISVLNPQDYASGHCYVDKRGIHLVDEVHTIDLSQRNVSVMYRANDGEGFFNASQGKAHLIDCAIPTPRLQETNLTSQEAIMELWRMTHVSQEVDDDLW